VIVVVVVVMLGDGLIDMQASRKLCN